MKYAPAAAAAWLPAAAAALLSSPAVAHEAGGAHLHPHLDPALLAVAVAVVGAGLAVALMRGRT